MRTNILLVSDDGDITFLCFGALMLVIEYIAGDEFGGSCRISYSLDDDPTATIASPGRYALSWRR
jgi:hypothetical protein